MLKRRNKYSAVPVIFVLVLIIFLKAFFFRLFDRGSRIFLSEIGHDDLIELKINSNFLILKFPHYHGLIA